MAKSTTRSPRATPPVTLPEYERLFRTIHALAASELGDPTRASLFFAVAGAYLLKRHHKLASACPVAGAAAYNLSLSTSTPANCPLVFGTFENERLVFDRDRFHCWIEAEGWVIDPMAPLFDEMLDELLDPMPVDKAPAKRQGTSLPRFMFQKPEVADPAAVKLDLPGAYLHIPNERLTTTLIQGFTENPAYTGLIQVADPWYARPPRKMAPRIGIEDRQGNTKEVPLSPLRIAGVW